MGMMGGGMAGGWSSNLGGGGHGPRSSWASSAGKMDGLVEVTTQEALAGLGPEERERLQSNLLTIRANLADRPEAEPETASGRPAAEGAVPRRLAAGGG